MERVARPALPGPTAADVCVVGAGYTGLWTSYYLARAAPELRVVVVEQRFAGYGASGRNGGWLVNSITGGRDRYVRTHGAGAAHRLQTALNETVDEVLRVVAAEGIDAGVARGGELTVATNDAQWDRLQVAVAAEQRWDHDTGVATARRRRGPGPGRRPRPARGGLAAARGPGAARAAGGRARPRRAGPGCRDRRGHNRDGVASRAGGDRPGAGDGAVRRARDGGVHGADCRGSGAPGCR